MTIDTSIVHECVICKGDIEHQKTPEGAVFWTEGHNAWPIVDGQCCGICNDTKVLPRRLRDAGITTHAFDVDNDDFRRTLVVEVK
tara:strand:+ start:439 stop:693 length:255 start_codon:yes stop_codon:yes gene_type:complete